MIKRTSRLTGTWQSNKLWIPLAFLLILISSYSHTFVTEAVRRGNIGELIHIGFSFVNLNEKVQAWTVEMFLIVLFLIQFNFIYVGCLYVNELCLQGIEYCFDG